MLPSPYCAELASLKLQRFRFSLAFAACCCSLFLSESGKPVFLQRCAKRMNPFITACFLQVRGSHSG